MDSPARATAARPAGAAVNRRPSRQGRSRAPFHVVLAALSMVAAGCTQSDSATDADSESPVIASGGDYSTKSGGVAGKVATAIEFTAPVLGGGELATADLSGPTVFVFWAPWCVVCRGEMPDVATVAAEFEGSVNVVGVAGRGAVDEMEQFVEDTGSGELTHVVDADGAIWNSFGVVSQPAFAFVDSDGEVEVVIGTFGEKGLRSRLAALVRA